MSLDSPGVKSGVQLSLDKQAHFMKDGADNNDQYVPMQSINELRYVKSPVLKLKVEENSGDKKERCFTKQDIADNRDHFSEVVDKTYYECI